MYDSKPVIRVSAESYENDDCCSDVMNEYFDVRPVDMNGMYVPQGNSASDRSRNLKIIGEENRKRLGCK